MGIMLLAGGQGSRLYVLTGEMAKPAVPFGGKYRIIDFPLSNCANSGIDTVGVLTQYRPLELNAYVDNGQTWDLDSSTGGVHILPPYQSAAGGTWYKGTANAIFQNIAFVDRYDPEYVVILSGDHIYKMDYSRMVKRHKESGAACTISVMEFLMGRSLQKNAYNLGVLPQLKEALEHFGFQAGDIFELEPDAGLGNGGLGRLAACYLDSMSTLEIPAAGYSICYDLGIFKQKIVEGQQVELPDNWKGIGSAWLLPKPEETKQVRFGGTLREFWDDGHLHIVQEGGTTVLAVPCDMEIAGYDTRHTNTLRLWDAKSPKPVDMSLYSRGEYFKATEDEAMMQGAS